MWSGREVRGWGLGCRDKEGLLGTIRGHVPSIFILIFAPGIGIWGLCVGRQLVVMYFAFSISARFPRLLAPFTFFFYIVFCGCTIN